MIKVAICGYGYWGKNLLRVFDQHESFQVVAAADSRMSQRQLLAKNFPAIRLYEDAHDAICDPHVEAVVLATPVFTHYPLARLALEKGKHVWVEKPMCTESAQALELAAIAARNGVALLVDHTFLFHPAVRKLKELVGTGAFGEVSYYDSLRVNLGLFQPDVNVLWDLAPHDLSIIDYLFGEEPTCVEATGFCHVNGDLPDIAYVTMHFPSRKVAHLNLSWMSPVKARRTAIGGSKKMAVWDDLDRDEPLRIYDSGITVQPEESRDVIIPGYRIGGMHAPRLAGGEALTGVASHFYGVIAKRERPIMDGEKAATIIRTLERAQEALDASLAAVKGGYNPTLFRIA